ncbi:Type I transmembrane sorting receptor [Podila horticola]|nr:Type I transmembrane sorting receptor [Podila horticola]
MITILYVVLTVAGITCTDAARVFNEQTVSRNGGISVPLKRNLNYKPNLHAEADKTRRLYSRQSEPLAENEEEGSADTWIPSSQCISSTCSTKSKYTTSDSSTSVEQTGTFNIKYPSGETASGPIYTDSIAIAGVVAAGQKFGAVTEMSSAFDGERSDGY